jgi:predicted transcriptional regulator
MSSLAEIQEAIEKLGPEERAELWTWFQEADEADEADELVAAVDEGIQAAEEGRVFTLEEIKTQMQSWITK